jgi:hypothetical protein
VTGGHAIFPVDIIQTCHKQLKNLTPFVTVFTLGPSGKEKVPVRKKVNHLSNSLSYLHKDDLPTAEVTRSKQLSNRMIMGGEFCVRNCFVFSFRVVT